nr:splicing factor, putative [Toxoplasma gondii RH]
MVAEHRVELSSLLQAKTETVARTWAYLPAASREKREDEREEGGEEDGGRRERGFGRLRDIDIKRARGGMSDSCYAFVEFETIRAAEDAVACRHGYLYRGRSLRVEFTAQPARRLGSNPNFIPMGGASGPPRRTGFRALVSFLPPGCRWQHLKDHMRRAGPVGFAEVLSHGRGVVEFEHAEDLKYAVRSLDKSEMRVEGRGSVIKVRSRKRKGEQSE